MSRSNCFIILYSRSEFVDIMCDKCRTAFQVNFGSAIKCPNCGKE